MTSSKHQPFILPTSMTKGIGNGGALATVTLTSSEVSRLLDVIGQHTKDIAHMNNTIRDVQKTIAVVTDSLDKQHTIAKALLNPKLPATADTDLYSAEETESEAAAQEEQSDAEELPRKRAKHGLQVLDESEDGLVEDTTTPKGKRSSGKGTTPPSTMKQTRLASRTEPSSVPNLAGSDRAAKKSGKTSLKRRN